MASHVVVLDASLKRTQVKVSPGTSLRSVLEDSCRKFSLDPDQHVLKNSKDKQLDLSLPFRLSGLVSGAKLQLVQSSRSPSVVSVALQLPQSDNSQRFQDKFPSNTPLWLILRKFEDGVAGNTTNLNLTERSAPSTDTGNGYLCYLQPVLQIMNTELSSFVDLQKTLAQLGYNHGSVLIRLSFRNDGVRIEEAKAQISTYLSALKPKSQTDLQTHSAHGAHAEPDVVLGSTPNATADNSAAPRDDIAAQDPSGDTIMTPPPDPAPAQQPAQDDDVIASSSETKMPSTESQFPSLNQGATSPEPTSSGLKIYSAPAANTPAAARETYNEADYQPSVEHATAHQAALTKASQNKRLASDRELEAARASKQADLVGIKSVHVRINLPDMMKLEATIGQEETQASLYKLVRDALEDPSLSFKLRCLGTKGVPIILNPDSDEQLITGLAIRGSFVVHFIWDDSVPSEKRKPVLKREHREKAEELKVQSPKFQEPVEEKAQAPKQEESKKRQGSKGGDVEAKMKRLLGFGRK